MAINSDTSFGSIRVESNDGLCGEGTPDAGMDVVWARTCETVRSSYGGFSPDEVAAMAHKILSFDLGGTAINEAWTVAA